MTGGGSPTSESASSQSENDDDIDDDDCVDDDGQGEEGDDEGEDGDPGRRKINSSNAGECAVHIRSADWSVIIIKRFHWWTHQPMAFLALRAINFIGYKLNFSAAMKPVSVNADNNEIGQRVS